MESKGAGMAATMMGLLRNAEEHELYLYRHDEEIVKLNERLEKLEVENKALKERIKKIEKR